MPEPEGGGRGPSKGVVAAIVLGVLVVLAGVVTASILLLGGDGDSEEGADPEPTATAEPTTEPVCADGDDSDCTPPTQEPTAEPTEEPSSEPTEEPTEEPTGEPVDGEPQAAVQGFIDAVRANDCPAAISYLSEELIKKEDANCDDFDVSGLEDLEYGTPYVVDADEDTATVEQTVDIPQSKRSVTLSYDLVYDGQWLIDELGDVSSGQ